MDQRQNSAVEQLLDMWEALCLIHSVKKIVQGKNTMVEENSDLEII